MSVGKIIKFLRKENQLTQDELAEILDISKNSIQKYEANEVPNLKIGTIRMLSNKFGISPTVFIFPENYRDIDLSIMIQVEKQLSEHNKILISNLNETGRNKVFEYAKDLVDSKNYTR